MSTLLVVPAVGVTVTTPFGSPECVGSATVACHVVNRELVEVGERVP